MIKYSTILAAIVIAAISASAIASHSVRSYYRHDGTYVSGHLSQDPGEARSTGYSYRNNELVPNNY